MPTLLETLRWQKQTCLDDGFICLVDAMGDDQAIVQAARVCYGEGTKKVSDDRGLIRYLMRHRHTTPFEMCEVKFLVRCPMDVWRQWIRHRTANVNEYSTRYSLAIDSAMETKPKEWRAQATTNKQGSAGFVTEWPEKWFSESKNFVCPHEGGQFLSSKPIGQYLTEREEDFHKEARNLYEERIACGVAREQARKDLPLSTYTEAYWKCDLKNIFGFLALRMDSHAQQEIRTYANAMGAIVKALYPLAFEAFEDYVLNSVTLSAQEVELVARYIQRAQKTVYTESAFEQGGALFEDLPEDFKAPNSRERTECVAKMKKLGALRIQLP